MAAGGDKVDSSKLLKALRDELKGREETIPDGWKKSTQFAEDWGFSMSHTNRLITMGVKKGLIEVRRFRISNGSRGIFPINHYRPKK